MSVPTGQHVAGPSTTLGSNHQAAAVTAAASATGSPPLADPASAAPQPGVAGQLAAGLRTLAGREDGVHVLTVRLHPDELGPVRVVARLSGTDVQLRVTTSTVAAAAAVTEAGPRLHDALAAAGLSATDVSVDHDAGLAQSGPGTGHPARRRARRPRWAAEQHADPLLRGARSGRLRAARGLVRDSHRPADLGIRWPGTWTCMSSRRARPDPRSPRPFPAPSPTARRAP